MPVKFTDCVNNTNAFGFNAKIRRMLFTGCFTAWYFFCHVSHLWLRVYSPSSVSTMCSVISLLFLQKQREYPSKILFRQFPAHHCLRTKDFICCVVKGTLNSTAYRCDGFSPEMRSSTDLHNNKSSKFKLSDRIQQFRPRNFCTMQRSHQPSKCRPYDLLFLTNCLILFVVD